MNPTNYTNTLQHFIQQLSHHRQHTHTRTQARTHAHITTHNACVGACTHCKQRCVCCESIVVKLCMSIAFTRFLTHNTEYLIALNNGLNESSAFVSDTSRKIVKKTWNNSTWLNSVSQGQPWQHLCMEAQHVKNMWIHSDVHFYALCCCHGNKKGVI